MQPTPVPHVSRLTVLTSGGRDPNNRPLVAGRETSSGPPSGGTEGKIHWTALYQSQGVKPADGAHMEGAGTQSTWRQVPREAPDCSPQTEPTWRGRALSPHGGGRHSAHMEGAGTQSTWRGPALRPHGGGGHSVHMEGAGTQSTWRGLALRPHGGGGHSVHIEGAATQFTLRNGQTAFLIPFLT
ncbi:unnamed protein product [Boreogadus saida]